jgi:hypothetical protein
MSQRPRRSSGIAIAAALGVGLLVSLLPATVDSAAAKPPTRPGSVSGLTLSASKSPAAYDVEADWAAASNATSYRVVVTNVVGAVLDQSSLTQTSYTSHVALAANTTVKVSVTGYSGRRHGKSTTKSLVLPDLTGPSASYTVTPQNSSNGVVTIEQDSLTDDVSAAASISQRVDWGDGTSTTVAGDVTSVPHGYGPTKAVYYPVVTVTDQAGNESSYPLTVIVADTTAPSGVFSASPANAWAGWTVVTVSESALSDDLSAPDKITRVVDWGDGSTEAWTVGDSLSHTYTAVGVHTPTVTIADEAGNTAAIATTSVDVAVDSVAPRARTFIPAHKRSSVRSWATLHGRAVDAGTGVRVVRIKAIEKRGTVWYAYQPARKTWVRAGKHASSAWHKARAARVTTVARLWSLRFAHLKRGVLVTKVSALDNVANASTWRSRTVKLTTP